MEYNIKVKDLPIKQQPREKLLEFGLDSMELNELLAIILSTGYKGENVLDLSQRILSDYGSKAIMSYKTVKDIMQDFNLPKVKSCQILACFEIGRRLYNKKDQDLVKIHSPEDVWKYVSDMHSLKKEYLRGLYLNTKHVIIHDEIISIGTVDQSIAHPRDIYTPALIHSASAVILVHNHPSGDNSPSEADLNLTKRVVALGDIMAVPLLDHIIVTKKSYKSII